MRGYRKFKSDEDRLQYMESHIWFLYNRLLDYEVTHKVDLPYMQLLLDLHSIAERKEEDNAKL